MSDFLLQRPIFDALERYLSAKDLMRVLSLDKRVHEMYKDDVMVWYKYCQGKTILACNFGRLDVIKYMSNKGHTFTVSAMDQAVIYGQLEIVKWLHENRNEGCSGHTIDHVAQHGHWEIVRFLKNNRPECRAYLSEMG